MGDEVVTYGGELPPLLLQKRLTLPLASLVINFQSPGNCNLGGMVRDVVDGGVHYGGQLYQMLWPNSPAHFPPRGVEKFTATENGDGPVPIVS